MFWMATRTGAIKARDLVQVATVHGLASAASFMAIIAARQVITLGGVPALALFLSLSYATTLLVLALAPSGRAALRDSISFVTLIASRS